MNTMDSGSAGGAGRCGRPGGRSASSLEEIVGLLQPFALRLLAREEPAPELLRAVNRSLVGPFRWAGLEVRRDRLGLLREKFECEFCDRFLKWLRDPKAREIAESPMSNSEKIALLRETLFADVDELEKSGEVILPEG